MWFGSFCYCVRLGIALLNMTLLSVLIGVTWVEFVGLFCCGCCCLIWVVLEFVPWVSYLDTWLGLYKVVFVACFGLMVGRLVD